MLMTTLGSEYWPQTAEGRLLALLLALFAFAIFGYVTATLATYFIGRDVEQAALMQTGQTPERPTSDIRPAESGSVAGSGTTASKAAGDGVIAVTGAHIDEEDVRQLQSELNVLREEISELHSALVELRQALSKAEDDQNGDKK